MRAFFVDVLAGTLPGQSDANSTLLFPQEDPRVCAPPLPPHRTHTSSLAVSLDASTPREEFPHWLPPEGRSPCSATPSPTEHPYGPGSGSTCITAVGQPTSIRVGRRHERRLERPRRQSPLGQSAVAPSPVSLPSSLTRASCVRAITSTPHLVEVMLLPPFALQKMQIQLQVTIRQRARGMQLDILRVR